MTMANMLSWRNEAGGVTNVVIGFVLLMMKSEMFVVGLRLVMIMIMLWLWIWLLRLILLCCVVLCWFWLLWMKVAFPFYFMRWSINYCERATMQCSTWCPTVCPINFEPTNIGEDLISRLCQKQYLRSSLFHLSRSYHQSCNWPIDSWIVTLILI